MAKKSTPTVPTVAIPRSTFLHIRQAFRVIEDLDELQCWGLTPSSGYIHVASDLARDLLKKIEKIEV